MSYKQIKRTVEANRVVCDVCGYVFHPTDTAFMVCRSTVTSCSVNKGDTYASSPSVAGAKHVCQACTIKQPMVPWPKD